MKGFTLLEIMVAMAIIAIALVVASKAFVTITKGITASKGQTIAENLAQEKIEYLKNLSYYRLLVSTAIVYGDPNFPNSPNLNYDQGTTQSYYPQETINVGGMTFFRRVLVEFVSQSGNDFVGQSWTANDTGIKRITVYVVWNEGGTWKKVELRNYRNNPNRNTLNFTFTGKVSSGTTGVGIYNALVEAMEYPSYQAHTDANGNYSFGVAEGSYTLIATATGYFESIAATTGVAVNQTGSYTFNFQMSLMATGQATGYAYINNHLLITEVVASTDSNDNNGWEWVELYNPTTYDILIASRVSPSSSWNVFFVTVSYICEKNMDPFTTTDAHGLNHPARVLMGINTMNTDLSMTFRSTSTHWTANTTTVSIPSNSFFLIANVSTLTVINGIAINKIADAYYYNSDGSGLFNVIQSGQAGGIRVTGNKGYSYNGRTDWHDGLAWNDNINGYPGNAEEGSAGINMIGLPGGFPAQGIVYRLNVKYSDSDNNVTLTSTTRNFVPFAANCFDRNQNGQPGSGGDWNADQLSNWVFTSSAVLNSDSTMPPYSGTPANGASVTSNDGLSQAAYVQTYGSFTVTNMATGTWNIVITSNVYTWKVSSLTITASLSTWVPNGLTSPGIQFPTLNPAWGYIPLTSATLYGYITGIIYDNTGVNPLAGVSVSVPGGDPSPVTTSSTGKYTLNVSTIGVPLYVTASKNGMTNNSSPYPTSNPITVSLGQITDQVNFTMVGGGSITGFVTTNGVPAGALPGIPVTATDLTTGTVWGSAITGTDGKFSIPIHTGTYLVSLQLDPADSVTPGVVQLTVTTLSTGTWSSTFTVTNAYGAITGTVGTGSSTSPITTGALIVASTTTITSAYPPDVTSSLRVGGQVYYAASSDPTGTYTISVRGGTSYYVYGWYASTLNSGNVIVSKSTATATRISVSSGATVTQNVQW